MISIKNTKNVAYIVCAFIFLTFNSAHPSELIDAVKSGNLPNVQKALESGANINARDEKGRTALMAAVLSYLSAGINIVELLLQHNPDLNIQDNQGYTALMLAILLSETPDHIKIVESLLQHKPDLTIQDNKGNNALMIAAQLNKTAFVDLLISKIPPPEKCCFLTFEQNDWNEAISIALCNALLMKIVSITSPHVLKKLFEKYPFVKNYCRSGKFTALASTAAPILVVIIPESLHNLGITIPVPEKQYVLPFVNLSSIENNYGFKNLHLLNPAFLPEIVEKPKLIKRTDFTNLFRLAFLPLINTSSSEHLTRFYLMGHGSPGTDIAGIPLNQFENFLTALTQINAEFLYINSCYAAGTNLLKIQTDLNKIITKQVATKEPLERGIDYAIVIQATSGIPTSGTGDINALFTKLNEFLKDPSWALEFGPGVEKPQIEVATGKIKPLLTITDVIASLGIKLVEALPSIRLPGRTGFFRSINIGNMEIITISKLTEDRVTKILELITQSKSEDKTVAAEAKRILKEPLAIKIPIKPDIKFIQIFPIDLTDFIFDIQGTLMPNFISKLTGTGQHFIGGITAKLPLDIIINQGFVTIFLTTYKAESAQCWFIKSIELMVADKIQHIKKLVIKLDVPEAYKGGKAFKESYAYINEKGEYIISKAGDSESTVDKETYESTIREWFESTIPSQETLTEATGGIEVTAEEKAKLEKERVGAMARRLFEPRFARTPQDLFNIFMAD